MAALFLSTKMSDEKWNKKWKFDKIWKKNATQIMIFLPHTEINLWGRKITKKLLMNISDVIEILNNLSIHYRLHSKMLRIL